MGSRSRVRYAPSLYRTILTLSSPAEYRANRSSNKLRYSSRKTSFPVERGIMDAQSCASVLSVSGTWRAPWPKVCIEFALASMGLPHLRMRRTFRFAREALQAAQLFALSNRLLMWSLCDLVVISVSPTFVGEIISPFARPFAKKAEVVSVAAGLLFDFYENCFSRRGSQHLHDSQHQSPSAEVVSCEKSGILSPLMNGKPSRWAFSPPSLIERCFPGAGISAASALAGCGLFRRHVP